jgi:hypothetical protein
VWGIIFSSIETRPSLHFLQYAHLFLKIKSLGAADQNLWGYILVKFRKSPFELSAIVRLKLNRR